VRVPVGGRERGGAEHAERAVSPVFDLAEGTIYPALHRLEASGLLVSRWEVVGGRRRRVYALSSSGRRAAVERRDSWWAFRRAVDAVFGSDALEAG
jgi:DNA-binding PadR family transcriptional regulator